MNRLVPLFLSSLLIWAACGPASGSGPPLRLYVFDCGRLNYDDLALFFDIEDDETKVRDLFVPCYVIEHKKGRMLWEGGLPSSVAETDGWREMGRGWRMRLDQTLQDQLARLGLGMSDFDFMSFSHFHFDHIGVARELKGARLIMQRREYEAAFSDNAASLGYAPELFQDLRDSDPLIIDGEHDVFGDGSVRLLPAPGHTPGHQVLYADLAQTGPLVLAGDLYVFDLARSEERVMPIDADPDQSLQSMRRIESFLQKSGATLWIGHDFALHTQGRRPPRFYD